MATEATTATYELKAAVGTRWFALGVSACAAAVGAFLLVSLHNWPPHEDETLALFVGSDSLGGLLHTVHAERGGAPLHFLVAWVVSHLGGGLTELRLASVAFAVASIPAIAALSSRLAGRGIALIASALASASWLLLFHGVFGRMYSLFLLTSTLSFLALLRAVERDDRRRWTVWALAVLATVASHPYGALVLATQALYVLARARTRIALLAFAAVVLVATPFWFADRVLAVRLDVGVNGSGAHVPLLRYLSSAAGDASSGFWPVLAVVLVLAAVGWWRLSRGPRLLTASVVVVPALVLAVAHRGSMASPESRHLVFILPFFSTAVACGLKTLLRSRVVLIGAVGLLLVAEVAWAWHRTPVLFEGEPAARTAAREAAGSWLARTSGPRDVLFGYDPVYLDAWQQRREFPLTVVPRADSKLAISAVRGRELGRGVWVLDAGDNNNSPPRSSIPYRLPGPARSFEAKVFGPYLIIRTRRPVRTPARYFALAASAMRLGLELGIADDGGNLDTILAAQRGLWRPARSRSTVSR